MFAADPAMGEFAAIAELQRAHLVLDPRRVAHGALRGADRADRVGLQLEIVELLRQRKRLVRDPERLGRRAPDASSSDRREHACRGRGRRVARELGGPPLVRGRLVGLGTVPPDPRERDLGFGGREAVAGGEHRVARRLERRDGTLVVSVEERIGKAVLDGRTLGIVLRPESQGSSK